MEDFDFDDISQKRPIDEQVQAELSFILQHEDMLKSTVNKDDTIADAPNSYYKAFRVATDPKERILAQDFFVAPDNPQLRKTLTVLVYLCDEITDLVEIADDKVFGPISMFGLKPVKPSDDTGEDNGDGDDEYKMGEREALLGKFLPTLQEIRNFVDRCYCLGLNMVQQLGSLLAVNNASYRSLLQRSHLQYVFTKLGELLVMLITVDQVVAANAMLTECWNYYKTLLSAVKLDVAGYGTTEEKVATFEQLLVTVNQVVLSGEVFKGCIEQNFEATYDETTGGSMGETVSVRNNQILLSELLLCLKADLEASVTVLGTMQETRTHRGLIAGSFALYALYRRLLPNNVQPDQKLHRTLWGIQKNIPFVTLHHGALWYPGEFLRDVCPFELKKPDPVEPEVCRREYIKQFDGTFATKTSAVLMQLRMWLILVESKLVPSMRHEEENVMATGSKELVQRMDLLLRGAVLANKIMVLMKTCLVAHSVMQIPLTKASLNDVSLLLEALKAIEMSFMRKEAVILEQQPTIIRFLSESALVALSYARAKLTVGRGGKLDANKADIMCCLQSMEGLLKGTDWYTTTRVSVLVILAEIVAGTGLCSERESARLLPLVHKIQQFSSVLRDIRCACDTTLLYHHLHILPPLVETLYATANCGPMANRLHYIFAMFGDGVKACPTVRHCDSVPFFLGFRDYMKHILVSRIIEPLSKDVETDLRLHTHTKHLDHMQALNPKTENIRPLKHFLDLQPIRIVTLIISIKKEVTYYLDRNFYNLTTVALHDWKTYADMKALAHEKLGLELLDSFLPMGSLDQGLDILQIMRNIHIFVGRFSYNMNMQQFIEFRPDKNSKHLCTIRIQSIAASIRQHGLGILNTTVNYTYQFLAQKFHIFNQFLFDEYIRAHLAREMRWFKKNKNTAEVNNTYPYERGMQFVKDIRKQGIFDGNKTCLDQFRVLITEIGNALGYVRMVRSAAMYYCSEAVKFLPEFDDIINFEGFAGTAGHSAAAPDASGDAAAAPEEEKVGANFAPETVRAAKNLDSVINTLVSNFGEGSDYFKVLVKVFQGVLLTDANDHLKTFCMIVPALCISWVEASLVCKENMAKVVKGAPNQGREIYFTDDGFAMGVAYILAILKQTKKNEALHWQDTINAKHNADAKALEIAVAERAAREAKMKEKQKKRSSWFGGLGKGKGKEEDEEETDQYEEYQEVHTLQLTGKKLESYRREFDQLFYSMNGAAIFFKRTDVDT